VPSSAERQHLLTARLAWAGLAGLLAFGACLVAIVAEPVALDWQPARAAAEPWRAWSAAFVHFSPRHLAANLAGAGLVGALGWAARVPGRAVIAWAVAWPLTQAGLLLRPDLLHYGGLSGVLHAGVAVVALHLLVEARGARRLIGSGLLVALALKVLSEAPWAATLVRPPGWDIDIAPLAHATGLLSGLAAAALAECVGSGSALRTGHD